VAETIQAQPMAMLIRFLPPLSNHAWFVSFAPRDHPRTASVMPVENSSFRSVHAAPKAGAIYQGYFQRTRGLPTEAPTVGRSRIIRRVSAVQLLAFEHIESVATGEDDWKMKAKADIFAVIVKENEGVPEACQVRLFVKNRISPQMSPQSKTGASSAPVTY
jgi:hypothetical protein